ncbi:predicted protein [Sclerotinia sclerotiorum 1980 UF-70]|uniref:Uncharacterized protein n=1 Tax=Sclerotinia sclerotiorum (strain ATCC 18683 / 1980 / Ss-1) TaxID=665079 RepID=A7ETR2_SCLS1|nr:predicted protein [Sclerotinia sclerotiorum 1980 UF-70]EDN92854.1 predicted protein [Sclerotinia sclerotiorum 1980 UF-70]
MPVYACVCDQWETLFMCGVSSASHRSSEGAQGTSPVETNRLNPGLVTWLNRRIVA